MLLRYLTSSTNRHVALNQRLIVAGQKNANELETLILHTPGEEFNEINLATAVNLLGKFRSRSTRCVDKLVGLAQHKQFEPRELTNLCHGMATTMVAGSQPMPAFVSQQVSQLLPSLAPRALTNILWSYSTLLDNSQTAKFAHTLVSRANGMRDFNAQDMSNTISQGLSNSLAALAAMNGPRETISPLTSKFANELIKDHGRALQRMLPKHLAACLTALTTLGLPTKQEELDLCGAFVGELKHRHSLIFSHQDLAQLCVGFAKLRSRPALWTLAELITAQHPKLQGFNQQDVASIAWAFATMGETAPTLFQRIVQQQQGAIDQYTSRTVNTLLWSIAKLEVPNSTEFIDKLCKRAMELDFTGESRQQATVLWSLAKLRHEHVDLCKRITSGQTFGSAQDVANTVQSLAVLNFSNSVPELAQAALKWWPQFTLQDVLNTCWGFACMDALEHDLVQQVFRQPLPQGATRKNDDNDQNTHSIYQQLAQVQLAYSDGSMLIDALVLLLSVRPALQPETNRISIVHLLVHDLLKESLPSIEIKLEHEIAHSLFVDMYFPAAKLVVEVDGLHHYFANHPTKATGKSQFRNRLILQFVDELVCLNSFDFWSLGPTARKACLAPLVQRLQS
ncbi:hypothetical protein BASA81_007991 [Batrachochytrium salamandrivorans]|nr:hypothetical protein BASA81_007991 [Batrachochytrium salamandrivorans]